MDATHGSAVKTEDREWITQVYAAKSALRRFFTALSKPIFMQQQSFSEAIAKVKVEAFIQLFNLTVEVMRANYRNTWHGINLLLIRYVLPIRKIYLKAINRSFQSKNLANIITFILVFLFVVYGYLFISLFYFGHFIHLMLFAIGVDYKLDVINTLDVLFLLPSLNSTSLLIVLGFIYLITFLFYRWMVGHLFFVGKLMSSSRVLTTIVLSNGHVLEDRYILRPSVDGNILIGNEATIHESNEKIMLTKQSILYIQFKKTNYLFGQEIKPENKTEQTNSITGSFKPRRERYRK